MIQITLPDGTLTYSGPVRGADIAARSGEDTADKALAIGTNGVLQDLGDLIERDACGEIITRDHPEALQLLRHDAAHVFAEAVIRLETEAPRSINAPVRIVQDDRATDETDRIIRTAAG